MSKKIKNAIDTLKKAMKKDPDYAWGWHCNIAVQMQDVGVNHKLSNDGAARFMKLAFDVNTARDFYSSIHRSTTKFDKKEE